MTFMIVYKKTSTTNIANRGQNRIN